MRLLLLQAVGGQEHAATFLGLPMWLWQIANLVLFFGLLAYFVGRPLAQAFRKRQALGETPRGCMHNGAFVERIEIIRAPHRGMSPRKCAAIR